MSGSTPSPLPTKNKVDGGVHQRWVHDSAAKQVSGAATYTGDIAEPPGTLQVFIATSTHAHAKITHMDVSRVRTALGVACVLTAEDIPGENDVSPVFGDDPMFAVDLVQYYGQSLFAVAADTLENARAAATLAEITYEDLPALLTVDQAMAADSMLMPPFVMERGDPDAAIAAAPHRLSGRMYLGGQEHFYLECQAAFAVPGEDGDVTVHSSTQHPSEIQHKVAHVLNLPFNAVTAEVRRMGGAFGGKESQGNLLAATTALVARVTGKAAKLVYDRDDDMTITGKRHDFRIDYTVGFDDDGMIQGVVYDHAIRCGMSWDLSEPIADRAMFHADNAYFLPHARITSYRCKTNTQSNTAFRGFGGPQGMVPMERIIEEIATTLGLDPLTVRQRNFYRHKDDKTPDRNTTQYGMPVEDCVIQDLFAELVDSSDYQNRRAAIDSWNDTSPLLKRGIAITPVKFGISFTKTFLNQAGALVHVYTDGSIHLNHGGTEMGQGLYTKVAQVVAEEFQVDVSQVKITATNTSKVPNTSATAASSGADLNGMAARAAAREIRGRLVAFLAAEHQAAPEDVTCLPGRFKVRDAEYSFEDVVQRAYFARVQLSATGFYATPKISWDKDTGQGRPFYYFAYGAAVSEVVIDTLTGENKILRTDILHDVGQSLNPAIDLGQVEGGFVQGAGWLTMEELVWDDKGRLMTHAPSTYKIPACSDRPKDLRMNLFDGGRNVEETIFRSKAVGEPPFMLGISVLMALQHAVCAAVGPGAFPRLDAPATPERILSAIVSGRKRG
ncbi:MAG: xanthine dehydrogenase molybdopterin binding subunit [Magnetospiraceae bacterium]